MDISIYSQYSSMALSYYSNWAPFQQLDYSSTAAAAIDDPELQSLLNNDDSFCNSLLSPADSANANGVWDNPLLLPHKFQQESFFSQQLYPSLFDPSLAAGLQDYSPPSPLPDFSAVEKKECSLSLFNPSLAALQDYSPPPLPDFAAVEKKEGSLSLFNPSLAALQDYLPPPPLPDFSAVEKKEGHLSLFNPSLAALQEYYSPPPLPLPDFAAAEKKEGCGGGSLSAQSVAARQRRRRITVKTQELGKLVPGGQKMNTAEMLQSAYKYIKFLQAQVSLLEFLASSPPPPPFDGDEEEFQKLLESPLMQEKLYSTEKCLVPQKLMEQLSCDQ